MTFKNRIQNYLLKNPVLLVIWAGGSSFLAYFCMYMYRKPFTAASFETDDGGTVDYKIILVIAQIIGYACSKFIGIRYISQLDSKSRGQKLLMLLGFAWLALVGLAITPAPYNSIWMFLNGLPLGLIWGIVFQYIEGRRFTEILTVILSVNFILTSGIAKSFGIFLLENNINSFVMPMIAGGIFLPITLIAIWALSCIPPPDNLDIQLRKQRLVMDGKMRMRMLKEYGLLIVLFTICYLLLTIIRDVRDNFIVEIWDQLGVVMSASSFTATEFPIALLVLLSIGVLYKIKNNGLAIHLNIAFVGLGFLVLVLSSLLFYNGYLSGFAWMLISGTGLFVPYVLFNGILFDRFYAWFGIQGNVGFLMYISDATGYLGSVGVLLIKNFNIFQLSWLDFYLHLCITGGLIGLLGTGLLSIAVKKKSKSMKMESK